VYDLIATAVTVSRYLVERGVEPAGPLLALSAAQAAVLGTILGPRGARLARGGAGAAARAGVPGALPADPRRGARCWPRARRSWPA
jgi:hypothetical protein